MVRFLGQRKPLPTSTRAQSQQNYKLSYRLQAWFIWPALAVVIVDQLLKVFIVIVKPNINAGIIRIGLIYNTGAGFGILQDKAGLLGVVSIVVVVGILWIYPRIESSRSIQLLWGMFLGGVIGNMIDRLMRGMVVDFLAVGAWPAFNIADAALSVSTIGLVSYYWRKR